MHSPANWERRAICRWRNPDLYLESSYPDRDSFIAAAPKVCQGCPVKRECLADATQFANVSRLLDELVSAVGHPAKLVRDQLDGEAFPDLVPTSGVIRGGVALPADEVFCG
ncbi:WhiB family transcriptional regulator [Tsukamurella soli]|uniref:4Fe-4S Wbl-type domain-containing protein n=1 Tax=Tsukamurella soli TaxID=644556 RepID=A0ABP8JIQ2_9ACTN